MPRRARHPAASDGPRGPAMAVARGVRELWREDHRWPRAHAVSASPRRASGRPTAPTTTTRSAALARSTVRRGGVRVRASS